MTLDQLVEQLYELATGWLGWSDKQAMTTNVCRMELALKGKIDFLKKTNPWGGAEEEEKEPPPANPAEAAAKLLEFFKRQQAHTMRHGRKK